MGKICLPLLCLTILGCKPPESVASSASSNQFLEIQKYHEALRAYFKRDYTTALASSNDLLRYNPNHDAGLYLISKIYFDQENMSEASNYLLQAGKADPENDFITQEIGYMYSSTGNYKKAAQMSEMLIQKNPYQSEHYYTGFENYLKAEDSKAALRILALQEKNLGTSIELYLRKYRAFLVEGQPDKAYKELERGLQEFSSEPRLLAPLIDLYIETNKEEKAMSLLKQLCFSDPENGYARYLYGDYLEKQGQSKEGRRLINESVLLKGLSVEKKAEIVLENIKSTGCIEENRYITLSLLKQNPKDFVTYTLNGDLMMECDEPFSALTYYLQALTISPNAYPVWSAALMIAYREAIWDSLCANSTRCIGLFPLQPLPYLMLGIANYNLNQIKEAETAFQLGKAYVIDNPELELQFDAYISLLSLSQGPANLVKSRFYELFKDFPQNYVLKAEMAECLMGNKNFESFVDSLIQDCNDHDPNQSYFIALKAKHYLTQKNLELAQEWINKAEISGYPLRWCLEFRGDLFFEKGNNNMAVKLWKEAVTNGNHSLRLRKKLP